MTERVVLTGHSGGLGAALARCWLASGAAVLGLSRRKNASLHEQYRETLREVSLDLADPVALADWLRGPTLAAFCHGAERVWLFNNAATVAPGKVVGEQEREQVARAVNLNVSAPLLLTEALFSASDEKTRLRVVHIGSGAGREKRYPGWSCYGATKAALDQHARVAAAEGNARLQIVSLAPGIVDTAMQREIRGNRDFPLWQRFAALKKNGALQSATETAEKIFAYCYSEAFAEQALADIRAL